MQELKAKNIVAVRKGKVSNNIVDSRKRKMNCSARTDLTATTTAKQVDPEEVASPIMKRHRRSGSPNLAPVGPSNSTPVTTNSVKNRRGPIHKVRFVPRSKKNQKTASNPSVVTRLNSTTNKSSAGVGTNEVRKSSEHAQSSEVNDQEVAGDQPADVNNEIVAVRDETMASSNTDSNVDNMVEVEALSDVMDQALKFNSTDSSFLLNVNS